METPQTPLHSQKISQNVARWVSALRGIRKKYPPPLKTPLRIKKLFKKIILLSLLVLQNIFLLVASKFFVNCNVAIMTQAY